MCRKCCCAHAIVPLVAVLLILPIAVTVLLATAFILDAMGDERVKWCLGISPWAVILWVIGLIVLVLLQGLRMIKEAQCCCHSDSTAGCHGHPSAEGEVA